MHGEGGAAAQVERGEGGACLGQGDHGSVTDGHEAAQVEGCDPGLLLCQPPLIPASFSYEDMVKVGQHAAHALTKWPMPLLPTRRHARKSSVRSRSSPCHAMTVFGRTRNTSAAAAALYLAYVSDVEVGDKTAAAEVQLQQLRGVMHRHTRERLQRRCGCRHLLCVVCHYGDADVRYARHAADVDSGEPARAWAAALQRSRACAHLAPQLRMMVCRPARRVTWRACCLLTRYRVSGCEGGRV